MFTPKQKGFAMLLAMEQSQENNVLIFPIQHSEDLDSITDVDLTYQAKTVLTRMLNKVAAGQYILTEKDKGQIRFFNETVTKYGYAPIDCDFENL